MNQYPSQANQNRQGGFHERQEIAAVPGVPMIPGVPAVPGTPGVVPMAGAPMGVAPIPPAAYPNYLMGAPTSVAPVRRVVHPTRYYETHTVTRYPVVHVFPTHVRRVHHNVYEQYCEYPQSASEQCCEHQVDCCPPAKKPTC